MSADADHGALLREVERDLERRPFWLVFSPAVETHYAKLIAHLRVRYFMRFAVAGLVFYNLFLVTDYQLMPDVFGRAVILQLAIVTPICGLNLMIIRRYDRLGEPLLLGIFGMIMLSTVLLYVWSRTPGALLLPFTFPVIVMAGNLLVPLSFRYAAIFSGLSCLAIIASVATHPGYAPGVRQFTMLLVLSTSFFTLFAGRRMEASERRAYLLTLRETVRAKMLSATNLHLRNLSETDGLTGIGNRRHLDAELARLWREAIDTGQPMGLLLMDIDHFKKLNDEHGHQAGDGCLIAVAALLRDQTRGSDRLAARFGGEEFVVLLPNACLDQVRAMGERLRCAVEAMDVQPEGARRISSVRISAGCAVLVPACGASPAHLIELADLALYAAKRAGRNRVHPEADEPLRQAA